MMLPTPRAFATYLSLEYNSLGQKKTVSFTVGPADLQLLDRNMHWVVVPGTFDMMIGKSSADIGLQGTLEVHESGGLAGYE